MIFHFRKLYVCISWYFFIMLVWVFLIGKIDAFLICLLALSIHEIGHIIMIYILKEKISVFYILPFGFCCRLKNQNKVSDKNMLKILLAGPVASIMAAGLFILWTTDFAVVNFIMGMFNLIPFWELDGGRMAKILNNK